jgi:hypothetical protein
MTQINVRPGSQSLMLSEGCQSLSNQGDTAWIFAFIAKHHTQPGEIRDMWLFRGQEGRKGGISIWCIPKEGKERGWETTGRGLEEEVLIFVKDSICYTLVEYLEVEFEQAPRYLVPDIVHPGD